MPKTILAILYAKNLVQGETQLDIDKVDLEHILPQNPKVDSEWDQLFSQDERDEYTNQIGNLTLWFNTANRGIKNAEFETKQNAYGNSQLVENQQLAKIDQ